VDIDSFLSEARATYVDANARTLQWMLGRPKLHSAFLNTKQNSITLKDYDEGDGWRGPQYLYGWIQGRGLEALVLHAAFFEREDPALAAELSRMARELYVALDELRASDGHAYFCYDADLTPMVPGGDRAVPQHRPRDLYTYSDVFVLKGLIAASTRHDPSSTGRFLSDLLDLVRAIEEGRFVMDERRPLDRVTLGVQKEEFGPWMIVLGAAALLHRLGLREAAGFGGRFITHVLARHWDTDGPAASFLLRDTPGEDHCNPGHAIEFVGFALDYLPSDADHATVDDLRKILLASFRAGFRLPGVCLSVAAPGGRHLSPYYPWWPLPETIRAAALAYERTRDPAALGVWRQAHRAFFDLYWRREPPLAYQTRDASGPVDFVPATPDLDPGYHTGLSLLGAIEAIDRLTRGEGRE
jgi:hypothetical protein